MTKDSVRDEHAFLKAHPVLVASIGISQTLLCGGIVYGWAALLPILRQEGVALTPTEFATVFTFGAIGNYVSNLPFGIVLDNFGPKTTGIVASLMYALGLFLCSLAKQSAWALKIGYGLLGFCGPAIQTPSLHLARLFEKKKSEGGGGSAGFMSAQAAAFDGGTAVFAAFAYIAQSTGLQSSTFFLMYLVVPLYSLLTAIFVWPNNILPPVDEEDDDELFGQSSTSVRMSMSSPTGRSSSVKDSLNMQEALAGPGSPLMVMSQRRSPRICKMEENDRNDNKKDEGLAALKDAPLSVVLTHPAFYALATWVAIHILKLNWVVATINDQLDHVLPDTPEGDAQMSLLVNIFATMLPFGFVNIPLVAYLLESDTFMAFQLANVVGLLYGGVMAFFPTNKWMQILITFVSVTSSRQLVYSTVFHQIGALFGFVNYGVLLGVVNLLVSVVSIALNPMVAYAESVGSYFIPNMILLIITLPLFITVFWASESKVSKGEKKKRLTSRSTYADEEGATNGERKRLLSM